MRRVLGDLFRHTRWIVLFWLAAFTIGGLVLLYRASAESVGRWLNYASLGADLFGVMFAATATDALRMMRWVFTVPVRRRDFGRSLWFVNVIVPVSLTVAAKVMVLCLSGVTSSKTVTPVVTTATFSARSLYGLAFYHGRCSSETPRLPRNGDAMVMPVIDPMDDCQGGRGGNPIRLPIGHHRFRRGRPEIIRKQPLNQKSRLALVLIDSTLSRTRTSSSTRTVLSTVQRSSICSRSVIGSKHKSRSNRDHKPNRLEQASFFYDLRCEARSRAACADIPDRHPDLP